MAIEVTDLALVVSVSVCFALVAALWLHIRSGRLAGASLPITTDWLDELSAARYEPMLRLLSEEDLRFLEKQPGYTPQMAARFRAERCRIFRTYLRSLQVDFSRVCTALKIVMTQSQQDRPDLASTLIRSQVAFTWGMFTIQFSIFLYRWGVGTVEIASLLKVFDGMRLELRTLVPVNSAI